MPLIRFIRHRGRHLAWSPAVAVSSTQARNAFREVEQFTRLYRANILIIGEVLHADRHEVLHTVNRHAGLDLFHAQRSPAFDLPDGRAVVLVLDDACGLSWDQQVRLLEWASRNAAQIVSFASRSLYDMVCEQKFIDRLYYHLNTVCIIVGQG